MTLLRAWKEVDRDIPLRVVGEGPLSHLMSSLPSHVRWLGQVTREDVCKLMAGARFLVFPSECYENFPLVLAEAFATGLPVVASAHGAALSIVDDGRNGVHFRPGDWRDLARRVGELWNDVSRLREMRHAARAEYVEKYTADRNYGMLLRIYETAVNASAGQC